MAVGQGVEKAAAFDPEVVCLAGTMQQQEAGEE